MNERQMQPARGADWEEHRGRPVGAYSRRAVLRGALGVTGAVAGANALVDRTGSVRMAAAQATPATPSGGECKLPSPAPNVPDAYVCPPPAFQSVDAVPGQGSTVSIFKATQLPPITPRDQNLYWQELEKRLGVRIELEQVPISNYAEKMAVLTASGELADLTLIWPQAPGGAIVYETMEQGAFADLTPYLTGDALQAYPNLARYPDYAWQNAAFNGRIYGVPRMSLPGGSGTLLYRRDWAEKFGVPEPGNADDVFALLTAMTTGDPDGNGQADTWGLSADNGSWSLGFINGMFRVPNGWRLEGDGHLTAALETEEFRQALDFARRLFAAGAYHPDAATLTLTQSQDALVGGRVGGRSASAVLLLGGVRERATAKQFNPEADVRALVPPGHDGGPGVTYNTIGFAGFQGIPASAASDEGRVRELLRILNYFGAPFGSEEYNFLWFGIEGAHHTVQPNGARVLTDQGRAEINELYNVTFAPRALYFPEAPPEDTAYLQQVTAEVLAIGIDDPTWGTYSPTAAERAAELSQLGADRTTAVITGREPLDAIDAWIQDWRDRGGDQSRQEYEEALAAR